MMMLVTDAEQVTNDSSPACIIILPVVHSINGTRHLHQEAMQGISEVFRQQWKETMLPHKFTMAILLLRASLHAVMLTFCILLMAAVNNIVSDYCLSSSNQFVLLLQSDINPPIMSSCRRRSGTS